MYQVTVRWWDGYLEEFAATDVRFGVDLLYLVLTTDTRIKVRIHLIGISPCAKSAGSPFTLPPRSRNVCAKKNALDPQEQQAIISDYLQALRLARGPQAADETEVYYRKGWIYIRPSDYHGALGIPFRPQEIKDKTAELRKLIPPRADSDHDGEPD